MRVMKRARVRLVPLGVLVVTLIVMGAGCGGSSTNTTVAPAPSIPSLPAPANADTIAANYVMFFDGTQPVANKIGLLENGQQYAQQLEAQAASPLGKTVSITISSVTITSSTTAAVKFSILGQRQTGFPRPDGEGDTAGWRMESRGRHLPGLAGAGTGIHYAVQLETADDPRKAPTGEPPSSSGTTWAQKPSRHRPPRSESRGNGGHEPAPRPAPQAGG